MWIRMPALALAALLPFLSAGAAQAQMRNSTMTNSQFMMQHRQMMNQMDMMRRSQTLQAMARAREAKEARGKCQGSAQGAGGTRCKAASGKPKAQAKKK